MTTLTPTTSLLLAVVIIVYVFLYVLIFRFFYFFVVVAYIMTYEYKKFTIGTALHSTLHNHRQQKFTSLAVHIKCQGTQKINTSSTKHRKTSFIFSPKTINYTQRIFLIKINKKEDRFVFFFYFILISTDVLRIAI